MKNISKILGNKKYKKIFYTVVFAVCAGWFIFRFIMVALESNQVVFNPIRDANENGIIVNSVIVKQESGVIRVPLVVNNNRAYVSAKRAAKLKPGQNVGDGVIVFVSKKLDLDSGMHSVKMRGVNDGINMVNIPVNCFLVPSYAVRDGVVMVDESGFALPRSVDVFDQDSEFVCISNGIRDGDIVILSKVNQGEKIRITK